MLKKNQFWQWLLCFMLCLTIFSGCGREVTVLTGDDVETSQIPMPSTPAKEVMVCPLDGEVIEETPLRPIVVTIDNYAAARPQYGISAADIMYELPAEGGISRYLALFYHGTSEKIGPVRSARPYLVDVAREWQAIYIHAGGSTDALSYLAKKPVLSINEISSPKEFWRDSERSAPHNLYTSTANLLDSFTSRGWTKSIQPEMLKISPMVGKSDPCNQIKISYPYAKTSYEYMADTGKYLRYVGGEPCLDGNTQEQLSPSNILVQKVSSKVLDKEGRLSISMVGSGEAWLFTRGMVWEGTWKRTSLDGKTIFTTDDGEEFLLSPGQTWIQVIDQNVKFSYEDTAENKEQ